MEEITLEKIWGVLIEVKTNLGNHLTDHAKAETRQFRLICVLLGIMGASFIAYFIK